MKVTVTSEDQTTHVLVVHSEAELAAAKAFWAQHAGLTEMTYPSPTGRPVHLVNLLGEWVPKPQTKGGCAMSTTKPVTKLELPVAVKKTTKMVRVPLDTETQRQVGQAMANLMVQIEHLRTQLAETVKAQRAQIQTLRDTVHGHARALSNGWRQEMADVEVVYDFNLDEVVTVFKGKVLESRPMTQEEKQLDLELCLQQGMELKAPKPVKAVTLAG